MQDRYNEENHRHYRAEEKERSVSPDADALKEKLRLEKEVSKEYRALYFDKAKEYDALFQAYQATVTSFAWKMTKPLRASLDLAKRILKSNRATYLFCKGIKGILRDGPIYTWKRVKRKICQDKKNRDWSKYDEKELAMQRQYLFPRQIKFSILVPLYNTPEDFLKEMIASVQAQTYPNWELCLADGSDDEHPQVGTIVMQAAQKDERIQYRKLSKNLGISGNTNACIEMATGDYIALFDHDDILHPSALYENMRAICEKGADFIYTDELTFQGTTKNITVAHFKPDFAIDNLRANNYICHFTVFQKSLLEKVGLFRSECDGSQDFDMVLRLTEQAQKIVHIPKPLYFWRSHPLSVASSLLAKPYVFESAKRAVRDHLDRVGLEGEVLDSAALSIYRVKYKIKGEPLISILIPNKDHVSDLRKCIVSIQEKTSYPNYEIIVIENNSEEEKTFQYYQFLEKQPNVRVVRWEGKFNYSAINNFGYTFAKGEYILLLNNDTEVISADWLQEMLMYAQRGDVGAVGAKLYYPDNTVQHGGVVLGVGGVAAHLHCNRQREDIGYMGRLVYAQDLTAVTAACMMLPRKVWEETGGLDESFEVAFNDVDLCMRIRQKGYLIVFTPYAELYHYEFKSRKADDTPEKRARFVGEVERFQARWAKELEAGDPYYNPNFSLDDANFTIR
ncbi:MAG TPA: glycosyltransferase [Ruminococcaceae bacterium]|nr:glycosyltransferase [Oscillospiraceae bacterium]